MLLSFSKVCLCWVVVCWSILLFIHVHILFYTLFVYVYIYFYFIPSYQGARLELWRSGQSRRLWNWGDPHNLIYNDLINYSWMIGECFWGRWWNSWLFGSGSKHKFFSIHLAESNWSKLPNVREGGLVESDNNFCVRFFWLALLKINKAFGKVRDEIKIAIEEWLEESKTMQ